MLAIKFITVTGDSDMKIKVYLEPSEDGGYTVIVPSLPGCISEGETKEEAVRNIKEAIELYLDPVEDDIIAVADAELLELAI
jgi:predicted RNase H-like HicB family nuclease